MTSTIDDFKGSDIIDVRDVIARVEVLREERDALQTEIDSCEEAKDGTLEKADDVENARKALTVWNDDCAEELETLESVLSDLCGYGGDEQWEGGWYPVTLIKDTYFEESMDEMVADCYQLPKDMPYWMSIKIDYEELKQDYSEIEFEGDTYYYR